MGYYKAQSGISHRMPDEYREDWESVTSPGDWWEWWHLGHEAGYSPTDSNVINKLTEENDQLRNLLSANVRVIKEELRKELGLNTDFNT